MINPMEKSAGRLSIWQAAFVVARRDFLAVLMSKAFLFFLLGPLFPVIVGVIAGSIGGRVAEQVQEPQVGVVMSQSDGAAMLAARAEMAPKLGSGLPEMQVLDGEFENPDFNAEALLKERGDLAAILSGTLNQPELTGTSERVQRWTGPMSLLAASALDPVERNFPEVATTVIATSGASQTGARLRTAQAAQTLLFLLIMMLAGMVLSNLVEEKGNKVIEILAAAIPMDAVFLGKLFAMLGVSMVGIMVWGGVGGLLWALAGNALPNLPEPGVGWPLFFMFGIVYFSMGYLLLGSVFLAIGSMAATVREVQTISMPATMGQLLVFFFANFALTAPGTWIETGAELFPLSSPFAMLAQAAQSSALLPHVLAIAWQALWVAIFVKAGATLFRRKVMKSGPAGVKKKRRSLIAILRNAPPEAA